jgi:hypothetical protein
VTDLAVLALGLGVIPLAAIFLYSFRETINGHREAVWGGLAGVIAFLALSHAMAFVLLDKGQLVIVFGEAATTFFLFMGLGIGAVLGWFFFEGPLIQTEPSRILWAAAGFVALHSFADGLVLGRDFVGAAVPVVRIDLLTISATVIHRLAEGAIVLVPALVAAWKPRSSFLLLFVAALAVPAAYIPGYIFRALPLADAAATTIAASTFVAAIEATLGLILLIRGFLPIAIEDRGSRWLVWSAVGFIGISVVHFLVE